MELSPRTLDYSDLPPGSRITCEQRDGTLHIILPPAGFWAEAKSVALMVGLQILLVLPVVGFIWCTSPTPIGTLWMAIVQYTWPDGVMIILGGLGFWLAVSWFAGNQGFEIELTPDKLILRHSAKKFRSEQEWPRECIADVRCRFSYVVIRARKGFRSATINRSSRTELQWLARTLRQAMGMVD
jgi:hypothetical protein